MEKNQSIKALPSDDQPRKKMEILGEEALTLSELFAILIGSGNKQENAVQLCQRILQHADGDLAKLSRYSIQDFRQFKGVGMAKALTIKAALELGKRRLKATPKVESRIDSSQAAFEAIRDRLMDLGHEEFWLLLLSRSNAVISRKRLSIGGISGTYVDPKILFKIVLDEKASGIILVHNHPSGNLQPSKQDISLTHKILQGAKTLDIQLLDHLILSDKKYFSFADEGILRSLN